MEYKHNAVCRVCEKTTSTPYSSWGKTNGPRCPSCGGLLDPLDKNRLANVQAAKTHMKTLVENKTNTPSKKKNKTNKKGGRGRHSHKY